MSKATKVSKNAPKMTPALKVMAAKRQNLVNLRFSNPQILVATLRPAQRNETLDTGGEAKAFVVQIQCCECPTRRWVNTQDAFQVSRCAGHAEAHKLACKRANRERRETAHREALQQARLAG